MKIKRLRWILTGVMLFSVLSFSGCAGPGLYSVNMYYDADSATIPAYLKTNVKTSDAVISVAEFTDTRQIDDRLVIGRVIEKNDMDVLVMPKNIKTTKVIANGIKQYLRKAGYKVADKIEQWDLKEDTIPQRDGKVLIGGNIEELEIYCRRGFPSNSYKASIKLNVVIADVAKGKILYESKVEDSLLQEYFWFSEEHLGDQASIVLGNAIEKLFEDKVLAEKLKEAIAN
jgi:ABC-type transport system substrate-binding protein